MATPRWSLSAAAALVVLFAGLSIHAQPKSATTTLPLRSVRLYETGVAYFERSGTLDGRGRVGLPVPASHLDDALKTLVVLGSDGRTTVSGIEFASSVTVDQARALAGLPSEGSQSLGYEQLLGSLKGAHVELKTRSELLRGRLVDVLGVQASDVETCETAPSQGGNAAAAPADKPCVPQRHMTILLLTDGSEIRRFRSEDVVSVKPTDNAVASRLAAGVDTVSSRGSQTRRELGVLASSSGPVTLGYIAEAPVWRSTYRLVLSDSAPRGMLQGWALLHNDTDEDWKKVHVELVNGQPTSFLFPLAAPRYARRELVTPTEQLSTVPQLQDTTVDNMWRGEDASGAGGLGLSGVGEGGGGRAEGIALGSIGTIGYGAGTATGTGSLLSVGNLAALAQQTDAVESGALFRYVLGSPIDLRAHGSALVPFLHSMVSARRVALLDSPGAAARAAVHVKNDTNQTLPAGPIAVFADGGFAGESGLDRLKPQESRLVSFGAELDVEVNQLDDAITDDTQLYSIQGDSLLEHYIRSHALRYEVVNRNGSPRSVYLELPFVNNATVHGADALEYDTQAGRAIAVFEVEARKQRAVGLQVTEGLSRPRLLTSLTALQLRELAKPRKVPAAQRAILVEAARLLEQAQANQAAASAAERELRQLESDLPGLRTNLAAVRATSDKAAEQFVDKIVASEARAQQLREQARAQAKAAKAARRRAWDCLVALGAGR